MNNYRYGLLFSLLACLLLSLLYCPPFDVGISDKEFFTYTGWAITRGQVPYRDFFDHKPPLIYLVNFIGILSGGPWGLWFLNTVLAMTVTASFFNACYRYRLVFPWLLPLLFNLMIRDPLLNEGINLTREYTSYLLILFFCLLMGKYRYRGFCMGSLAALIFFMQQEQVLAVIPFLVYAVCARGARTPAKRILPIGAGFSAVTLLIVLYFVWHRSLGEFWKDAFLFNIDVYTAQKKSIGDHFRTVKRVLDEGNYELPFMTALCTGLVSLITVKKNKSLILAAFTGLLLSLGAEFMGGRTKDQQFGVDFLYYFIPLSAGVCLLLFTVFAFAQEVVPPARSVLLPLFFLVSSSLGYTALQHATHLRRRDRDAVIDSPELNYLRQHRPGNYQLYVFQKDDFIAAYYEFRILSPSRWIYQHFWTWYENWDPDGRILRSIGQDLQTHHTEFVIMDPADSLGIRDPANNRWWLGFMNEHYRQLPLPGKPGSRLWQRKD
jgi:hypothetical protein